jgi:putative ABC transport system permease protein
MTRHRLVLSSLMHHWRTNLAVLMGVVAATAVIGGALIVGDSVRASLRQMTLNRLGNIDFAVTGPRFFREDLAKELKIPVHPAIVMQAALQCRSGGTLRRAGQVNVYGFNQEWPLIDSHGVKPPQGAEVVLNAQAAAALQAKVGEEVTLWIFPPPCRVTRCSDAKTTILRK